MGHKSSSRISPSEQGSVIGPTTNPDYLASLQMVRRIRHIWRLEPRGVGLAAAIKTIEPGCSLFRRRPDFCPACPLRGGYSLPSCRRNRSLFASCNTSFRIASPHVDLPEGGRGGCYAVQFIFKSRVRSTSSRADESRIGLRNVDSLRYFSHSHGPELRLNSLKATVD
jgi:hypothetical protein